MVLPWGNVGSVDTSRCFTNVLTLAASTAKVTTPMFPDFCTFQMRFIPVILPLYTQFVRLVVSPLSPNNKKEPLLIMALVLFVFISGNTPPVLSLYRYTSELSCTDRDCF